MADITILRHCDNRQHESCTISMMHIFVSWLFCFPSSEESVVIKASLWTDLSSLSRWKRDGYIILWLAGLKMEKIVFCYFPWKCNQVDLSVTMHFNWNQRLKCEEFLNDYFYLILIIVLSICVVVWYVQANLEAIVEFSEMLSISIWLYK